MRGRVLVVAGSDSGGGAGLQADIKTITALGAYAMTAVTAITVQDTRGVHFVHPVPPATVAAQIACVLDDLGADAIKTGMLGGIATVEAVSAVLEAKAQGAKLVVDPVMLAKGGAELMGEMAVQHLRRRLFPLATLITPNLPEAEVLSGVQITGEASMRAAVAALRHLGVPAVLLKGGHLDGPEVLDLLATEAGIAEFRAPRIITRHTHGTGCTLASAIAAGLAQGMELHEAVARAHAYVQAAIRSAPGFGHGNGPLNHAVTVDPRWVSRGKAPWNRWIS